jgi:hypothetical protein
MTRLTMMTMMPQTVALWTTTTTTTTMSMMMMMMMMMQTLPQLRCFRVGAAQRRACRSS